MSLPFPVEVAYTIPNPYPSADLREVAIGTDGCEYALKGQADHSSLPATEWFCYHLASKMQLAVPQFVILQQGTLESFGSRFEGGVKQWSQIPPPEQKALLSTAARDISRIIAMDLFVGNDDRHLNNFLFRNRQVDGGLVVFTMDYSRSLFIRGWPKDAFPLPPGTKTMMVMNLLKQLSVWDGASATLALATIQSVSSVEAVSWLKAMPNPWMSGINLTQIGAWWGSTAFDQRLADCNKLVV